MPEECPCRCVCVGCVCVGGGRQGGGRLGGGEGEGRGGGGVGWAAHKGLCRVCKGMQMVVREARGVFQGFAHCCLALPGPAAAACRTWAFLAIVHLLSFTGPSASGAAKMIAQVCVWGGCFGMHFVLGRAVFFGGERGKEEEVGVWVILGVVCCDCMRPACMCVHICACKLQVSLVS